MTDRSINSFVSTSQNGKVLLFGILILSIFLLSLIAPAFAGGPANVSTTGVASAWDNSSAITYHPEDGTCGPFSNATMNSKFETALAIWSDLEEVDLTFTLVAGSIGPVGIDNYEDYLYLGSSSSASILTDEINPVLYDDDAEIIAEFAGEDNAYLILGFAGAVGFNSTRSTINEGQAIINCRCLQDNIIGPCYLPNDDIITVTEEELESTILHEMGHFLNLDHSQVNAELYDNGNASDDANLPIMFPFSFEDTGTLAAHRDDIAALGALYPSSTFDSEWCTVTGTLVDSDGNEIMCVDVWALTDDKSESISFVTGSLAVGSDTSGDGDIVDSGECTSRCGYFELKLKEGLTYTLTTKSIDSSFVGSSRVGPCLNSQLSSVGEEVIATIESTACTGGATVVLGDLTATETSSGSGTSGTSGTSGGGTSGGGSNVENPVGYTCAFQGQTQIRQGFVANELLILFFLSGLGLVILRLQHRS